MKNFLNVLVFMLGTVIAKAQYSITVNVPNIKTAKGNMMLRLQNENGADVEKKVVAIDSKTFSATFSVATKGKYAISIYQDANKNKKLDKNFFGAPSEAYGFSNNVKETFSEPSLKAKLFSVTENTTIIIKLNF